MKAIPLLTAVALGCVLALLGCYRDPADSCPHRWSKWHDCEMRSLDYTFQQRECQICGAIQLRRIDPPMGLP